MIDPNKCAVCQKPIQSKNGIEGGGHPYFVTCKECGAKNEIKQIDFPVGGPVNFEVVGLLK
jgi:transcription elongation factor Elf1